MGQLAAFELMAERLDHRKSDKQQEEGKNAASVPRGKVDPYHEALRDSLGRPSVVDIYSGKPLNELLGELQRLREWNVRGPKVPLGKDDLLLINFVTAKDTRSAALLKNRGKVTWPEALRASTFETQRELLDSLLPKATQQAGRGRVDSDLLKEMQDAVRKIEDELARARREEQDEIRKLPTTDYIKAKRFVSQLGEALRVLGEPGAENYFNGRYAARSETVAELVDHMTREGLQFAPAVAGDETGYVNLHRALAVCVVAALDSLHAEE